MHRRLPEGPLREYLAQPFPDPKRDCREVEYLSLDLETTGLSPKQDRILSFGHVVMKGMSIELGGAAHRVVRVDQALDENNVVIHQLTDDAIASGEPLAQVMRDFLKALAGRVLLAHHAELEFGFIDHLCRKVCGERFLTRVVDTQWIARRTLERRNQPFGGSDLRLFNLREHYNLPRYNAHNALSDALAAAELFAAQVAEREAKKMPLGDFLRRM